MAHVSSHWRVDVLHYLPRLAFRAVQNRHAVHSHGPHSGARAQLTFCAAALVPAAALLYAWMVCMDVCICASERMNTVSAALHDRDVVSSAHTGALHILSAEAAPVASVKDAAGGGAQTSRIREELVAHNIVSGRRVDGWTTPIHEIRRIAPHGTLLASSAPPAAAPASLWTAVAPRRHVLRVFYLIICFPCVPRPRPPPDPSPRRLITFPLPSARRLRRSAIKCSQAGPLSAYSPETGA
ncbi:hypothetical protein HYPSUDRAFT_215883 [Hypholoma sublateritium FD-334 SS-4]|uniref:Uncharacterized protein n=1 Tax=Hypholoma sublateritium (strain FD-334 SS-4) TaxID=945553 RepID=A0A0D2PR11_HYPSF|nr:hypothetical protein HYPSUDRAFT_215883 [Hypholoma sublateritium FD-334 SS-4]